MKQLLIMVDMKTDAIYMRVVIRKL